MSSSTAASPKSHLYDAIEPSESDDPALENAMASGASPVVKLAEATAVGGTFGGATTVMLTLAVPARPSLSMTVRVAE